MELLIDGAGCDLGPGRIEVPGFDAAVFADLGAAREGRRLVIDVPATPANDALFGRGRDPETADRFNAALHRAELRAGGGRLMRATVRLLRSSDEGYRIELRDGGAEWVRQAARMQLRDLDPGCGGLTLSPAAIRSSWTDDSPVKFFPVRRDSYAAQSGGEDLLTPLRTLSVEGYHPFVQVAALVGAFFAACGYTLRSDFLSGDFFRSLYLSGAYAEHRTAGAEAGMGFRARRLGPVSATADFRGRVEADPSVLTHTVGNLVETASPTAVDADGIPLSELYNNGHCFAVEEGRILFRPTTSTLPIGFCYTLHYTTDHRIRSRDRLTGFDSLYLDGTGEVRFTLPNRYTDRRDGIAAARSYRVIVFDHAAGDSYRLLYTLNGVGDRTWTHFAARSAAVETPSSGTVRDPKLQVLRGGLWADYTGDWALYDGYIGETGRTTVSMQLRSPAELLTPSRPKYFDRIYFFGAEEGQQITLHKECTLQPWFGGGPAFGSWLTFGDLMRHNVRVFGLLEALAHLFNLRFRTDEAGRTVRIEPRDRFYDEAAGTIDWRSRTDTSQPAELTDTTVSLHELRTWCYGEADGPVLRREADEGSTFGAWSCATEGFGALEGEQTLRNPLFHPTLGLADDPAAPSARVLHVGDRDDPDPAGPNFTLRIVRYLGMQPLPAGEWWSDAGAGRYPLAAFHFEGSHGLAPCTLCFEDRDGAAGLHRFYDRQLRSEQQAGRIALTLRLAPHEFEALLDPAVGPADLQSVFRLRTPFGETRGVLRRIEPFDPAAGCVRCTFDRIDR